jgi:hypothetical protein
MHVLQTNALPWEENNDFLVMKICNYMQDTVFTQKQIEELWK